MPAPRINLLRHEGYLSRNYIPLSTHNPEIKYWQNNKIQAHIISSHAQTSEWRDEHLPKPTNGKRTQLTSTEWNLNLDITEILTNRKEGDDLREKQVLTADQLPGSFSPLNYSRRNPPTSSRA